MSYKDYIIFALAVLALILLILMSPAGKDFWQSLPKFSDLATSPATRELAERKPPENSVPPADSTPEITAEIPANEEYQEPAFEENISETEVAIVPVQPSTAPDASMADIIMIPEINITAPLVTAPAGTDAAKLKKMLDCGAVAYPDSVQFGGVGQTIVLGHSAPPGWPEIKHDTIFSRIAELSFGSKIVAVYNDKTYTYSAVENRIIEKGGDIPKLADADSALVLVTCWPPGRDLKRMVVQANLVSVE